MIYEGTVDVLAEYEEQLCSPSVTWQMPAVVRLRRNVGSHKKGVKFSRMNVYQRDKFTCQYCGKKFRWSELTYDHLVPRARGGRRSVSRKQKGSNPRSARARWPHPLSRHRHGVQAVQLEKGPPDVRRGRHVPVERAGRATDPATGNAARAHGPRAG